MPPVETLPPPQTEAAARQAALSNQFFDLADRAQTDSAEHIAFNRAGNLLDGEINGVPNHNTVFEAQTSLERDGLHDFSYASRLAVAQLDREHSTTKPLTTEEALLVLAGHARTARESGDPAAREASKGFLSQVLAARGGDVEALAGLLQGVEADLGHYANADSDKTAKLYVEAVQETRAVRHALIIEVESRRIHDKLAAATADPEREARAAAARKAVEVAITPVPTRPEDLPQEPTLEDEPTESAKPPESPKAITADPESAVGREVAKVDAADLTPAAAEAEAPPRPAEVRLAKQLFAASSAMQTAEIPQALRETGLTRDVIEAMTESQLEALSDGLAELRRTYVYGASDRLRGMNATEARDEQVKINGEYMDAMRALFSRTVSAHGAPSRQFATIAQ